MTLQRKTGPAGAATFPFQCRVSRLAEQGGHWVVRAVRTPSAAYCTLSLLGSQQVEEQELLLAGHSWTSQVLVSSGPRKSSSAQHGALSGCSWAETPSQSHRPPL